MHGCLRGGGGLGCWSRLRKCCRLSPLTRHHVDSPYQEEEGRGAGKEDEECDKLTNHVYIRCIHTDRCGGKQYTETFFRAFCGLLADFRAVNKPGLFDVSVS